jgi:ankyrin repeat protein
MLAITNGNKEIVRRLLDQERYDGSRSDLTLRSNKGDGALSMALQAGLLDVAEWLLSAGADGEAENEGTSILNQCIIRGTSAPPTHHPPALHHTYTLRPCPCYLCGRARVCACVLGVGGGGCGSQFTLRELCPTADSPSALFMLEQNVNVHTKTSDGTSALNHAIKADLEDVTFRLCALGADVNEMDENGTTPLWLALMQKKEKIAFILVRNRCDLNFCTPAGIPAIHRAIDKDDDFSANFLIRNGADVNIPTNEENDKNRPLHAATAKGFTKTVVSLLQQKADINKRNGKKETPTHVAVRTAQTDCLNALLKHPQVDLKARDAKVRASSRTSVCLCLSCHIDLRSRYRHPFIQELTAFGVAIMKKSLDIAKLIKAREPAAADQPNAHGMGLLHTLIEAAEEDCIKLLLESGVDVKRPTSDASHRTPLHLAVERGDGQIVRLLLKAGADHKVRA